MTTKIISKITSMKLNIALKTEYSFKQCYMPMRDIHKYALHGVLGIADCDNTFGHFPLQQEAEKHGFKPIYGVRLRVSRAENAKRRTSQEYNVFIATSQDGLIALYKLVAKAYANFYFFPRLFEQDINGLHPDIKCLGNVYENFYPTIEDRKIYQILAGGRKNGESFMYNFQQKVGPMHIIPQEMSEDLLEIPHIKIPIAPMIRYEKHMDLLTEAIRGSKRLGINLDIEPYKSRLAYEFNLIQEKEFQDYFKIVSSIIKKAKRNMLVGPGRGSSGGSFLCYLLGITAINPFDYGLLFERFIDVNRYDFPDIDTDYPDTHRPKVLKDITETYGESCVKNIGTVITYKADSAINEMAMTLKVPKEDTEEFKSAIIERSGGDARAEFCVEDSFTDLEIGKKFIEKYPKMRYAGKLEAHAKTAGTHAAGVIISNIPLTNYCGVNPRDNTIMLDGIAAEKLNLLKIDCLGLRTLSVLMETARLAGFSYQKFYKLKFDDKAVFDLLNNKRYSGIFQFDGQALGIVTNQMGIEDVEDMVAVNALSRPGALNSGGTARFIKRRTGIEEPQYYGKIHERVTKPTYGVVIYQEQTMQILREVGNLSWGDVNILRKAMSKSYGDEFFGKFKADFVKGALENGHSAEEAEDIWTAVASMGSYGFNKSHAVAYAMISYWTAWCKAHYPLEFTAANLNHEKDSSASVKILRDFVTNENGKYVAVDPDKSDIHWSIKDGMLVGGLCNIEGIGEKKAKDILAMRKGTKKMTPGVYKKLLKPTTPYDIIFPAQHYWHNFYEDPISYGITPINYIKDVIDEGEYTIIGRVYQRDLRNRNDTQSVIKRGGKLVDKNIYYLNLYLEDDTDMIKCTIPPHLFEDMDGQKLAESAQVGKTWFMVRGKLKGNWRNLSIVDGGIVNLNQEYPEMMNVTATV